MNRIASGFLRKCSDCLWSNQNFYYFVCFQQITQMGVRLVLKLLGPILFIIGISITVILFSSYMIIYLPCYSKDELINPLAHLSRLLHLIIALYIFYSIVYNHIKCSFTSPGNPPECTDPGKILGQSITGTYNGRKVYSINQKVDIAPGVSYKLCRLCDSIKPPRAHHCSVLNKCVFHMDHYCPWMNNCIGYYNYRYFVLFLFYVFLSTVYVVLVMRYDNIYNKGILRVSYFKFQYKIVKATIIFIITLAISSFISVGFLLAWHIYLILTNQTTIEFYQNSERRMEAASNGNIFKNPYNKGYKKNLKRVFGDVSWYIALLPIESKLLDMEYPIEYNPSNFNIV